MEQKPLLNTFNYIGSDLSVHPLNVHLMLSKEVKTGGLFSRKTEIQFTKIQVQNEELSQSSNSSLLLQSSCLNHVISQRESGQRIVNKMAYNERLFYVSAVMDLNIRKDSLKQSIHRQSLSEDIGEGMNFAQMNLHNVL